MKLTARSRLETYASLSRTQSDEETYGLLERVANHAGDSAWRGERAGCGVGVEAAVVQHGSDRTAEGDGEEGGVSQVRVCWEYSDGSGAIRVCATSEEAYALFRRLPAEARVWVDDIQMQQGFVAADDTSWMF